MTNSIYGANHTDYLHNDSRIHKWGFNMVALYRLRVDIGYNKLFGGKKGYLRKGCGE